MSSKSTLLLEHHLKELKLPSFPKPESTEGMRLQQGNGR